MEDGKKQNSGGAGAGGGEKQKKCGGGGGGGGQQEEQEGWVSKTLSSVIKIATLSHKNSWDTKTVRTRCFFTSGPSPCPPNVGYRS